ncbi:MAG: hypothetical protein NPIRA02_29450 [Nitrospirales bacterium]|nr:MAG: hypothetical protein NPIRA02_29450 [Nitrospirales bacterium]
MLQIILQIVTALPAIIKAVQELIPLIQEAEQTNLPGPQKREQVLRQYEAGHPSVDKNTISAALELGVRQVKSV